MNIDALYNTRKVDGLYRTEYGVCLNDDSRNGLDYFEDGSINLILTSPPFSNQRKKEYDVFEEIPQDKYCDWLLEWAYQISKKLADDGSLVIDIRSAYEKGKPVESLFVYEFILRMCREYGFTLCQTVMWNNSSALPLPIEYVNKQCTRLKSSLNFNLWFSKNPDGKVKANNKNVLVPYSSRMQNLINNPGSFIKVGQTVTRPSGNTMNIGSWAKDNGGAKSSNLLNYPNSDSNSNYMKFCKELKLKSHPARWPAGLCKFWIQFLTEPSDVVVDIFSGSNVTGMAAEELCRQWVSFDISNEYVAQSSFRFIDNIDTAKGVYEAIKHHQSVTLKR